jgi:hypothetical protein
MVTHSPGTKKSPLQKLSSRIVRRSDPAGMAISKHGRQGARAARKQSIGRIQSGRILLTGRGRRPPYGGSVLGDIPFI